MSGDSVEQVVTLDDCWNRIGVWSRAVERCPELERVIHCRNCERYATAGRQVLTREMPAEYRAEWTERYKSPRNTRQISRCAALLFRLGDEWLGLPSECVSEITAFRPIHGLPHRSDSLIKGLVNIRGELKLCVSIGGLLQLNKATDNYEADYEIHERMILIEKGGESFVFPVSEVHGIYHYDDALLESVPVSVGKAKNTFTTHILKWNRLHVGLLDDALLFLTLAEKLK